MREKIKNLGFLKGVTLLFLLGFLLGIGVFWALKEPLAKHMSAFYNTLTQNLTICEIAYMPLLRRVVAKNFQSFFLMALFGISILSIPYIAVFLIYKGFSWGFFLASALAHFGKKGILIGLFYGFPQMLFYAPAMVAMMHKGYYMASNGLKKKLFLEQLPSVALLLGILLVGCIMETYINTWILKGLLLW